MVREPFAAVDSQIKEWCENITERLEGFEDVSHSHVSEVCDHSYDGFFAFTAGGYNGTAYGQLEYAYGSGTAPTVIQPYIDSALKDAREEWDSQNPGHPLAWIDEDEDGQTTPLAPSREREHWREKYWEFESNWLREGGTYFYKVRAIYHDSSTVTRSKSGEPEVLFCVGINTDFDYGRDNIPWLACYGSNPQLSQWVWERTIKVADLTDVLLATMSEEAFDSLRSA